MSNVIFFLFLNTLADAPFAINGVPKLDTTTTISISYEAPSTSTGEKFASISFTVTDYYGATSSEFTILINTSPNHVHVATVVPPFSFAEDTSSSQFSLSGTDVDIADSNSLCTVIISLPTKSSLLANGEPVSLGQELVGATYVLLGNINVNGEDSFQFAVKDNVNAISDTVTVRYTITVVDDSPVVSNGYTETKEDERVAVALTVTDVDTALADVFIIIESLPNIGPLVTESNQIIKTGDVLSAPYKLVHSTHSVIYLWLILTIQRCSCLHLMHMAQQLSPFQHVTEVQTQPQWPLKQSL